jgi:hypothetical protein
MLTRTQHLSLLGRTLVVGSAVFALGAGAPVLLRAQDTATTAPAAKPTTFLGTVQAMSGSVVTVKNDAGATMLVTVGDGARLLRIEPGQKTLTGASPFSLVDLQPGDRVMARGAANPDGKTLDATMLVAIKGADIAKKQEAEREDWQKNGTGGLVKAVDPTAQTVTISIGAGNRTEVIHATPATIIRRYAPGSVKFDQAVKSTLDQIKPGDQLRARGPRSADATSLDAQEIVSGSFRNLAGAIVSTDPAASTLTLNDVATKKSVIVTITPDSEVKKLEPAVAQRLAARMNAAKRPAGPAGTAPASPGGDHAGPAAGPSAEPPAPGMRAGADFQQLLSKAPAVTLKDLPKGSMVIVVATEGETPGAATAITVVAGVEPMLQASTTASQAMLSSSWNLGGGGGGGEGGGEASQ